MNGHDPLVEKKARKECLEKEAKKNKRVPRAVVPSHQNIGLSKKVHPVSKMVEKKKKKRVRKK